MTTGLSTPSADDTIHINGGLLPQLCNFFFQCSSVVQILQNFIQKLPCQVPRVLDLVDCPLHNIVHDIVHYPNYYDPLYYPKCYPELFVTPSSVVRKLAVLLSLISPSGVCVLLGITFWKLNSLCSGEIPTI